MGVDDFIMIGPAARLQAAGSIASLRVAGMAVGRFTLADGRPGDQPWMAAEMVEHFVPSTVPILTRHGGDLLGYLDTLRAEGPDLHFTGEVSGWADLRELIGYRGHSISIEPCGGLDPRDPWYRDGLSNGRPEPTPLSVTHPYFKGAIAIGHNLIGVALTDRPAATGSYLWIVE